MILSGLLVDLVPYNSEFIKHEQEWRNGPMRRFWGIDGLLTQASLERMRQDWQAPDENMALSPTRFGMQTKDGIPIGMFVLMNFDGPSRIAEVGAGIGNPDYWGGGYGSDGMLLITEYAFRWLDLRRLYLTTMGVNTRAQRQVEKCGFKREGSRRSCVRDLDGTYCDFLYYGLMREEWPGRDGMVERLGLRDKALAKGYSVE